MDKTTKILLVVGVGVVALLLLRKQGEKVTENYSTAEGWSSALGGLHQTLHNTTQDAINNATDQVIKLGDKIADWRNRRYNNAQSQMLW